MMRISQRKLVLKVDLKGNRFRVSEDAIIDGKNGLFEIRDP